MSQRTDKKSVVTPMMRIDIQLSMKVDMYAFYISPVADQEGHARVATHPSAIPCSRPIQGQLPATVKPEILDTNYVARTRDTQKRA